jgi:hypothetical protein
VNHGKSQSESKSEPESESKPEPEQESKSEPKPESKPKPKQQKSKSEPLSHSFLRVLIQAKESKFFDSFFLSRGCIL